MTPHALALGSFIPSPPVTGFHLGPTFIHFYGLLYVIVLALPTAITRRPVAPATGDPALVYAVAPCVVPPVAAPMEAALQPVAPDQLRRQLAPCNGNSEAHAGASRLLARGSSGARGAADLLVFMGTPHWQGPGSPS